MAEAGTKLRAALRRLRVVVGVIVDRLDLEPAECVVEVKAHGSGSSRLVASVSLADCFAETDRLLKEDA
jgi:hypothetical protein